METTIVEHLKAQTEHQHSQLDESPLLAKVLSPNLTKEEYSKILCKMKTCFTVVEEEITSLAGATAFGNFFYESRIPLLDSDLQALQELSAFHPVRHERVSLTQDSVAGMFYVLHGSSLGGKFIARKLAGLFPSDALQFYGSSERFIPSWLQFKNKLNQEGRLDQLPDYEAGANWAFQTFKDIFRNE